MRVFVFAMLALRLGFSAEGVVVVAAVVKVRGIRARDSAFVSWFEGWVSFGLFVLSVWVGKGRSG